MGTISGAGSPSSDHEMSIDHDATKSLHDDALRAMENEEMVVEYQPKICARSRDVLGIEALVRWNHPEHGRMAPNTWLPAIAKTRVIERLGEHVLGMAMADHARLRALSHDLRLAVNIAPRHFRSANFADVLRTICKKNTFDAKRLELDIPEGVLFGEDHTGQDTLSSLKELGCKITIDDFGRGYSNLLRLAELAVDFIKFDRSIIKGAQSCSRIRSVMAAVISLARDLEFRTVAEQVETVREVDFITHMGVDMLQGYYFAHSMDLDDLVQWLEARTGAKPDGKTGTGNNPPLALAG